MELAAYIPALLLKDTEDFNWANPLDSVYIGEVFCEKREDSSLFLKIASKLRDKGKKVYISTSIMPTNDQALRRIRDFFEMANAGIFDAVCVNDAGALQVGLEEYSQVTIHVGPYLVGIRNYGSAKIFEKLGVKRIAVPHDFPMCDVSNIAKNTKVEIEIFVHGPIPLITSRRCLLLRAYGTREGESCGLLCESLKRGMPVATLDSNDSLLILAGTTGYSAKDYCLIEYVSLIKDLGLNAVRIEEWNHLRPEIYQAYRKAVDGDEIEDSLSAIKKSATDGLCNGWFFEKEGHIYVPSKNLPNSH